MYATCKTLASDIKHTQTENGKNGNRSEQWQKERVGLIEGMCAKQVCHLCKTASKRESGVTQGAQTSVP